MFSFLSPYTQTEITESQPSNEKNFDNRNGNDPSSLSQNCKLSMPPRQSTQQLPSNGKNRQTRQQETSLLDIEEKELLNSPIGSFQASTWLQVESCLRSLRDREEIYRAFQLLNRAVQEPDARIRPTSDMVYRLVQDWLMIYIRQQQKYQRAAFKSKRKKHLYSINSEESLSGDQRPTLSPVAVWKKIESYQRKGIQMESLVYQKIIDATSHVRSPKPNHPSGPILAETILDNMMAQSERKNPLLRPSVSVFRAVLTSWDQAAAYCPEVAANEAPHRAMAILNKLRALYDSGWGDDFLPDKLCFYKVMNIYAHLGDGDQVESLLEDLYGLYVDHDANLYDLRPTTPFFSLVLYAWSRSSDPGAAERAEAILDRMLELEAQEEIRNFTVETNSFNIVIICWSKLRTIQAAKKAQKVFDRLVALSLNDTNKKPTGGSYFALLTTWSRHDPFKTEAIYRTWTEEYEKGNTDMRQDSDLLKTIVGAWFNSNEPTKARRCDDLIQEAIQHTDPQFKPTTAIFNMAISAWCNTKTVDGLQRAEELLLQMEKCNTASLPDVLTYLSITQAWVSLGRVERAEELLTDCFLQIEGQNNWQPEKDTDAIDNSEEHNSDSSSAMSWKSRRFGRHRPSKTEVLNCVLKGWRSKADVTPEAASKAEQLLLSTHSFGVKPNAASFQYVLDAWRKHYKNFQGENKSLPKIEDVLAMMERLSHNLGGDYSLYLKLQRDWRLLSIR
ncbi:hypothetical protein IV203_002179 [Nitzschia inconspicua]|uniref:Pentatricopeptide repeat-containing protein n=1 Tax=Nitzschia inconspicua TaxID=303405 RepID=A0A9K3PS80_9STRA|nr:hypothetical protein IV203_002179 [Nitzschia inconspicua]